MNQYKAYFGKKDIYPSWVGNFSTDEVTLPEDIFEKNGDNESKSAGKPVGAVQSKNAILTMVGMLLIIMFLNRKRK